jgi:hypothetical protein
MLGVKINTVNVKHSIHVNLLFLAFLSFHASLITTTYWTVVSVIVPYIRAFSFSSCFPSVSF